IIAYGSMFPKEISPLVPSLQSNWLFIHVITVSIAQGILAISFVAGLIYLILKVDHKKITLKNILLERVIFLLVTGLGFSVITTIFASMDYEAIFQTPEGLEMDYHRPAISGPKGAGLGDSDKMEPLFRAPTWFQGEAAPRKLNTLIWSFIAGTVLYGFIRLLTRKRVGARVQPWLRKISPQLVDEVMYRS